MAGTVTTTASSLEGQLLELVREISQAEEVWVAAGVAAGENRQRRFTLTPNFTTGTVAISGSLPITFNDAVDGFLIQASPYLP